MSEFHELHGDYVANAGQQINLQGYLDYFEPLGSALSRLADGAGGPFVYQFTASGGRTIGTMGWVVSAASKRFGGWKLWGAWANRPIPAIALPLFWPALSDPSRVPEVVDRANADADELFDRKRWRALCGAIETTGLRHDAFRELLKAELSRAYAAPLSHRQPLEVELTPRTIDLLPWLYILGPVDPSSAQIQPGRFTGPGYQYILTDREPPPRDTEIPSEVDAIVDAAASDLARGWKMANELRARRAKPKAAPAPPPRERRIWEEDEMPPRKPTREPLWNQIAAIAPVWTMVFQIAALALLAWIALNVHAIRKATVANSVSPATSTSAIDTAPAPAPVSPSLAARDVPDARLGRIAQALVARPPQGIRVNAAALDDSEETLARAAVEVFLRRNACFSRAETVDGKISAAELRAIGSCTALRDSRLAGSNGQIDNERAIAWLERTLSATR